MKNLNNKMIGLICIILALMIFQINMQTGQIEDLRISEREFNLELREQVKTEIHVMTFWQFYEVKERLDLLEDAMWLEGYERTREESMPHMNNRLLLSDFNYMLKNRVDIMNLDKQVNFPYVTQLGKDAPAENDCGPAAISMVTKFYGIESDHSIRWIHEWMVGTEDLPTNYTQIVDMLETYYTLNTKVIVTHPAIKEDLVEQGYTDGEDIEVIDPEDFPDDKPVIWIYSQTPHWIVRYKNWAYDSLLGIRRFEATENIYRPDYGLGIIVTP